MLFIGVSAFAEKKEYKHGEVTAYYKGNKAEIVDNVNNVCIIVSVERTGKNSAGEWLYEFACNNKKTKALTKLALKGAIDLGITSVAGPAGGAISSVATTIALEYYNDVCEYFGEK